MGSNQINRNSVNAFESGIGLSSHYSKNSKLDFREAMSKLFNESNNILKNYADPNTSVFTVNGFGEVNKSSPSAQLAVGIAINRVETQMNTLLSGLEFSLKTLPQKIDSLFG